MQEATGRTAEPVREPRGARALLGAAIAMVGALATVHPTNVLLVTLSEVVPQLAAALPLAAVSFRAGWAGSSDLSWVGRGAVGEFRRSQRGAARQRSVRVKLAEGSRARWPTGS